MGYEARLKKQRLRMMQAAEKKMNRVDTNKTPNIHLEVDVMPNGQVVVRGPLHAKETCIKVLYVAIETIIALPTNKPEIIAPPSLASGLVGLDGQPLARNGG